MITFNVVRERHGWAVRSGACMMTPFWSRDLAIREANSLAEALRRHGQQTEVVIETAEASVPDRPTVPAATQTTSNAANFRAGA